MEQADEDWTMLLRHLAVAGPSTLDDLQTELSLKPKELKDTRSPLERCGSVVARSVVFATDAGHVHSSELARWDQVVAMPVHTDAHRHHLLADLLVAAVSAAVIAPERELKRWFSWPWYWEDTLVDGLVAEGRLARPEAGWIATAS